MFRKSKIEPVEKVKIVEQTLIPIPYPFGPIWHPTLNESGS